MKKYEYGSIQISFTENMERQIIPYTKEIILHDYKPLLNNPPLINLFSPTTTIITIELPQFVLYQNIINMWNGTSKLVFS